MHYVNLQFIPHREHTMFNTMSNQLKVQRKILTTISGTAVCSSSWPFLGTGKQ